MTTPYLIFPVEGADVPTIAEYLLTCKLRLTINRLLYADWPNETVQRRQCNKAVQGGFDDPNTENLKVVDVASGALVGYLGLTRKYPPKADQPGGGGDKDSDVPEIFVPHVYKAVVKSVGEVLEETNKTDHFDVTYILVKPSYRRRGIGSQLMREAFARAEAAGIPLNALCEPAAYEFFAGQGLKETKQCDVDLSKWAPSGSGFGNFRFRGMVWSK
ncbi:hypothetical protein B0J13DRAFT_629699 [Dactylonectria estremocensis]|uniref:N-acetyltransferase domain-containing protein n=1 Tax=Dactylonectria estremocensis TaxID=1079267 RepID=A0A9P9DG04_9HYPO|nr:hypothetical protein B0J13DRAFT_629699 [Dactylonectria estremocensis]